MFDQIKNDFSYCNFCCGEDVTECDVVMKELLEQLSTAFSFSNNFKMKLA